MTADIVLPLAFEGTLTYRVPASVEQQIQVGMRVIVPIGKKKLQTGIVLSLQETDRQTEFEIKELICLLDDKPMVLPSQLKLWQWVADYYMCTLGEVMKAALPAVLKLESETHICLNEDFEAEQGQLSPTQEKILDILNDGKEHSISEIEKTLSLKSALPQLNKLLLMGALRMSEYVADKQRNRFVLYVSLTEQYRSQNALQQLYTQLQKAPKQQLLLSRYLEKVRFGGGKEKLLVAQADLLQATGADKALLNVMIKKGVFQVEKQVIDRLVITDADTQPGNPLNQEQTVAYQQILEHWKHKDIVLLHGVTSSGKTEVYIKLIFDALQQGKQALFLVPEIALTTQLTDRLRLVFGSRLGVYHSRFSDQERAEVYRHLALDDKYDVLIGVRSSVLLPFKRLGLVIVDEEHDQSYKQQEPQPHYHARNVAMMLARQSSAKVLLGSATPSVESYFYAASGKYGLVSLTRRYKDLPLPQVRLIDMKLQRHRKEVVGHFADPSIETIKNETEKGRQVIVFQNRRGYAPYIECPDCAFVPKCVNCDVSLTLHKWHRVLQCHYCGYTIPLPSECPNCHSKKLRDCGVGTEKIEDELQQALPSLRLARMDLDTTRRKSAYEMLIQRFEKHEVDVLIGTQMVTKGLHFNDVSTVVVVNADTQLYQPDFRSYERAFQMLEQVSGRAGRNGEGKVLVQTSNPEHAVFKALSEHDYMQIFRSQIKERQDFKYPPFYRLISVYVKHKELKNVEQLSLELQAVLKKIFTHRCSKVIVPAVSRTQNMYIRQIMLKIETTASFEQAKLRLKEQIDFFLKSAVGKGGSIIVDVDPY